MEIRRDNLYGVGADGTMPGDVPRRKLAGSEKEEQAPREELAWIENAARESGFLERAYGAGGQLPESLRWRREYPHDLGREKGTLRAGEQRLRWTPRGLLRPVGHRTGPRSQQYGREPDVATVWR